MQGIELAEKIRSNLLWITEIFVSDVQILLNILMGD